MALRLGMACALGTLLLPGCGGQSAAPPAIAGTPQTLSAQAAGVTLSLTLQPAQLPFTEKALLTVEAVADKGVTVDLASYENALADGEHQFEFRLRRIGQKNAEPIPQDKLRWVQNYQIEFFLPGEYELPGAKLTMVRASGAEGASQELKTEKIKVVAQATEAAQIPPEELKKIELPAPAELHDPPSKWWWASVPAVLLLAAIAFLLRRRRSREQALVARFIPAHEWARRAIAELVAADLISKGLVQEFYYRISGIVRGYIERRYGVSAPEMTTEEFLIATAGDFRFASHAAGELQNFLTACDLVKYARHRPAAGEWNDLLRTAASFIERTRKVEQPGPDRTEPQMAGVSA